MCHEILFNFFHTIKFHSYDHDNVSFIERINNFHFSCHRYYSFKSCLKILKKCSQLCCYLLEEKSKLKHSSSSQLHFKNFPKGLSECAMLRRLEWDRRNTNLNKNIVIAATVTMNSALDNAGVLDPLLKFMFTNWDVTQFIILLIIKK